MTTPNTNQPQSQKPKFQIGDKVRILDGRIIVTNSPPPFWVDLMIYSIGEIGVVTMPAIYGDESWCRVAIDFDEWDYHINWLELATPEPKKGFDPETLTFDGVGIVEGDQVEIGDQKDSNTNDKWLVVENRNCLCINLNQFCSEIQVHTFPLHVFNVVAHFPAPIKDEKLERLEKEFKNEFENIIYDYDLGHYDYAKGNPVFLDRYYQARKNLEDYKSKNGIE
jgi:hypothetical protein